MAYNENLKKLPKIGWSHHGLKLAYERLNDAENATRISTLIKESWVDADFEIEGF